MTARAAVIDIGSNTIRLLIGRITNGRLERIESIREVTRLGKELVSKGVLNRNSIDLSIRSLIEFKVKCDSCKVGQIIAIGTSALREASDANTFLKIVKEKVGIDVKVITGETEADLTIKGINCGQAGAVTNPVCSLVVDIGGGSTEMILNCDTNAKFSLPVGAVKLFELFIKHDPPSDYELSLLCDNIRTQLHQAISIIRKKINSRRCDIIATGGTPTTLAAMHLQLHSYDGNRVHGTRLPYSDIKKIYAKMISIPIEDRRSLIGLESSRADIIIPGTLIIISLMDLLEVQEVVASDYGLMEGILYDTLNQPESFPGRSHVV
jgi:exopolyphosphatase/guanosine-5'-triphosphate,3'-diphosphate pyrophosphatase